MDNGLWSVPIDFACLKAGVARVPLNPRLSLDEQASMIEATGVRLLVHTAALAERASELVARLDGRQLACLGPTDVVDAPDLIAEMSAASARDPLLPARSDDPVVVVDRTSDMIITGGYNVYPREVEEALLTHPAVAAAAVVGAPDETWVEAVTAFVTLRPGVQPPVAEELRGAVRARLAGYKVPKEVHVVDALPLSPVGKVLRRALRDPLWGRS